jgi:hypothetical protein
VKVTKYVLAAALASLSVTGIAQDTARQIWDDGFRQKRPAPAARPAQPASDAIVYRPRDERVAPPTPSTRVVGVTIWRLRPEAPTDRDVPRLLVQEPAGRSHVVPERVAAADTMQFGDRLRLGIEVSERGYVYVVNRERYADGSVGAPYLIFPAVNLRGGDHRVEPGRLIEIPSREDPVPALVSHRSSPNHIGEELMIVVMPEPVRTIVADRKIQELPATLVASWERLYGGTTARLDLAVRTEGGTWTPSEQVAGGGERLLTQADPMPQALYRAELRAGGLLVHVPLPMR